MKKRNFIALTLAALWMVIIFCFSAQTAGQSNAQSDGLISLLFSRFAVNGGMRDLLTVFVRKSAHFSEYAVLGALLYLSFSVDGVCRRVIFSISLMCSMCYAATDELHQVFVPGRAGRLFDICIDSLGALCGILCLVFLSLLIRKIRIKNNSSPSV